MQNRNLQLSEVLSKFNDKLHLEVHSIREYEHITETLREHKVSFKSSIVKYKRKPSKYYINILEHNELWT